MILFITEIFQQLRILKSQKIQNKPLEVGRNSNDDRYPRYPQDKSTHQRKRSKNWSIQFQCKSAGHSIRGCTDDSCRIQLNLSNKKLI